MTEESLESTIENTEEYGEDIVVFDSLDTIQGYEDAPPGENKDFYLEKVAEEHGMTKEEMLENVETDTYLQWTYELLQEGKLTPRTIPKAKEVLEDYIAQGIRPVVITADIQGSADITVNPYVELGLIDPNDVYAIQHLGSKKESDTWIKAKNIYEPNTNIVADYEDTKANLEAALKAYKGANGFLVKENESGLSIVETYKN